MFTGLRLCYYRCLTFGDNTAGRVGGFSSGVCEGIKSIRTTWKESPSIFQRSPLDGIAEQRLFGIERNFLKLNNFEYPPLRPSDPPPGHVRVEYYTEMARMYQGKWDCWADLPLLQTGELDIENVKDFFALDPGHFAMIDPVRWKNYPINENSRLSPITVHNVTCGREIPLRFVEVDLPKITAFKRIIRSQALIAVCMFKAIYDLFFHLHAYDEYQFDVPLPWLFLGIYNFIRDFHPKTRRNGNYVAPDLDVLSVPSSPVIGGRHLSYSEYPNDVTEMIDEAKLTNVLSGLTRSHLYHTLLAKVVVVSWLVAAEVVACKQLL